MIYLFTGTPGSGKSLHMARIISKRLKSGLPTIGNFVINPDVKGYDSFTYVTNSNLCPDLLINFSASYFGNGSIREGSIYLFIDEAQLLFNSRDWSRQNRMDWIEFMSQHRHYGYNIYMVTQTDRMLDRQIRSLAEYEVIHRKVSSFGFKGKLVRFFVGGELFCAATKYYGMRSTEQVHTEFYRGSKKLYSFYDSYANYQQVPSAVVRGADLSAGSTSTRRVLVGSGASER